MTIWTFGHSTRTSGELVAVLAAHDIEVVADIRRFPGSRRLPHFAAEPLEHALDAAGIGYRWLPSLGGRRRPAPDSPNAGWRVDAFRGYADHLATEEFAEGLFELLLLAGGFRTAMMCSELLWWRCHRRLVSDVLLALDRPVLHIRDTGPAEPHRLAPPAQRMGGWVGYPG